MPGLFSVTPDLIYKNKMFKSDLCLYRKSLHKSAAMVLSNSNNTAQSFFPDPRTGRFLESKNTTRLSLENISSLAPILSQFQRPSWRKAISPKNSIIARTAKYACFFSYLPIKSKLTNTNNFNFIYHD